MNTPTTHRRIRRTLAWLLTILTGALLLLLTSPTPAMACGVSYESGTDPNAGCSGTAPVVGATVLGASVFAAAVTLAVLHFVRGAMSETELTSVLTTLVRQPPLAI